MAAEGRSRRIVLRAARWGALVATGLLAGCTPDIAQDRDLPETMPFDPEADPPLLPQPTNLVIDPATHRIDFGVVGLEIPDDCATEPAESIAQCEFYRYLESLDGFPTDLSATAPVTAPPNLGSASVPDNVVVVDATRGTTIDAVHVDYDAAGSAIAMTPDNGWDVGTTYVVGLRGYARGLRSEQGRDYVASVPYFLLKQEESLTCGAKSAADLGPWCPYFELLATPESDGTSVFRDLSELEAIRQLYAGDIGLWARLAGAGLPKDEAATAWAFPTHSASVVELNPALGMLPRVVGSSTLRLRVKGTVDDATLSPFALGSPGTAFLLDLTELGDNQLLNGLPEFQVSLDGQDIVLTAKQALVDGHLYGILLTRGVTNTSGEPLVPPPLTVLLRSRGPLTSAAGASNVDGVSDADAGELEAGRQDLAELLDDPTFKSLTGLDRESLAYLYAFTYPNP